MAALIGLGLICGVILLRQVMPDPFIDLRGAVFDRIQRFVPRAEMPVPVTVIDIDDASLDRMGQWPWPRDRVAGLVDSLHRLGAGVVALDMVFAEPDERSPAALFADWRARGLGDRLPEPSGTLPDFDAMLAASLTGTRTVLGFALTGTPNDREPLIKPGISVIGPDPAPRLSNFSGAVTNLDILERAAAGNGNFSSTASGDGVVRSMPLLSAQGDQLIPSLVIEALRVAQGQQGIAVRTAAQPHPDMPVRPAMVARVGAFDVPLSRTGEYPLHYRESSRSAMVPAWRVMETPDAVADAIQGHIVFVGTSAAGLSDLRVTPMNPREPGVNIHAQAVEQILGGQHLFRPLWAPVAEHAVLVLAALGLLAVSQTIRPAIGVAVYGVVIAGIGAATVGLFSFQGLILDPVLPVLGVTAVFGAGVLTRVMIAERDKAYLRHAFGHYLAPEMVRQLADRPEGLTLGGEAREMTFLFTDLEGFTRFTETVPPETLVATLNAYLAGLCAIVLKHGGTIDKIVGDAVHAMFNAPIDQADHADRAVRCALEIDAFATNFARERSAAGPQGIGSVGVTRIGINTGRVVVGNFGGGGRFDYTAHGDAINVAARLEAANKHLGTRICVAATTVAACQSVRFRPIGALLLKGKAAPIDAFEPQTLDSAEDGDDSARTAAYIQTFTALSEGRPEAAEAVAAFRNRFPDDPLGRLYADRLAKGETGVTIRVQ